MYINNINRDVYRAAYNLNRDHRASRNDLLCADRFLKIVVWYGNLFFIFKIIKHNHRNVQSA